MIVLRKRMFDLKMQETNSKTPEAYMEWEKELYRTYHENVFRAMKCLQAALINTRPSVAITILTFICLSVFFMVLFVSANAVSYLIQFTTAFLRNMHG